jgi:ABC-type transport system involved in cytochrome bd biosynthesis fused ATPase/permease subunit
MLDCTWNDSEAATAVSRLLLKEQMQEKLLAANPKRIEKLRETALVRLALKRIAGTATYYDTF